MLKIIYLVSVSINVVWSFSMVYAEDYMASTAVFVSLMHLLQLLYHLLFFLSAYTFLPLLS